MKCQRKDAKAYWAEWTTPYYARHAHRLLEQWKTDKNHVEFVAQQQRCLKFLSWPDDDTLVLAVPRGLPPRCRPLLTLYQHTQINTIGYGGGWFTHIVTDGVTVFHARDPSQEMRRSYWPERAGAALDELALVQLALSITLDSLFSDALLSIIDDYCFDFVALPTVEYVRYQGGN